MAGLLSRERIIAKPGFNRWLVPPAALAIHLSIGMAYGFSVFWLPLSRAIGITESVPCPDGMGFFELLVATSCDWKISMLGWMYTLFFVFLGSSAAVFGRWLEHAGPRKAGVVAAFCWGGGFLLSALGVHLHQIWLMWLGSGVIGGCGLGLGYISPVSTLIKWFPDRRGMATGMAIMGFGGGAMIGAPLADLLMKHYATPTSVGVVETFLTLGAIYFVAMLAGAFGYRIPPPDWQVAPRVPKHRALTTEHAALRPAMITTRHVHVDQAWKTPQFWLLWGVLCLNVSAGIGVIGMASPMIQEVFGGRLVGLSGVALRDLNTDQRAQLATIGAAFAALLSVFNIAGRIGWASLSDYLGRKRTYAVFFALGTALYAAAPFAGRIGSVALFVLAVLRDPDDVRRRIRDHSGVSRRYLRHSVRGRDPRPAADRVVGGRHPRAGAGELHPGIPDPAGHSRGTGLQRDDVRAGGAAGGGVLLQPGGAAGGGPLLHVGFGAGARANAAARSAWQGLDRRLHKIPLSRILFQVATRVEGGSDAR